MTLDDLMCLPKDKLAEVLTPLHPQLLALWDAAKRMHPQHRSLNPDIYFALDRLNAKAEAESRNRK